MVNTIKVEVHPIVDDAKHWMKSYHDHTLESILAIDRPNALKSSLTWIANPKHDGVPKLLNIRKTGEYYSPIKGYEGAPIYCAVVELPLDYFETYKTAVESEGRHEVRIVN